VHETQDYWLNVTSPRLHYDANCATRPTSSAPTQIPQHVYRLRPTATGLGGLRLVHLTEELHISVDRLLFERNTAAFLDLAAGKRTVGLGFYGYAMGKQQV